MLGNGTMAVGLNEHGLVHDFYYPYVGLDNLTTARDLNHRIGVWVSDTFSWVDDEGWEKQIDFEHDALVSVIVMTNKKLDITLEFSDFVDSEVNAFCRQITVRNLAKKERTIRVFMHQFFEISSAGRGDTAMFVPEDNYILDYKGRCALLISGKTGQGNLFDQFSIGNYGIEGKEGTFRDAEDGELSNNPIEHGGVDSVYRFSLELADGASSTIDYWVIAADSQYTAEKLHYKVSEDGLAKRLAQTRHYWYEWLDIARDELQGMRETERRMLTKSLMIIKAHTDKRGGVIASCDSSIYNYGRDYYSYVWPRDGGYAMWPLIRLGYTEEPKKFFEFCRDILTDEGYLMHKYQPDRAIGSTWHPLMHGDHKELAIQEDETAIVVYMLGEYLAYSKDRDFVNSLYVTLVQPAANFMAEFRDEKTKLPHASYDLWEQKFLTTTYTTAMVYQALLSAADFADLFEYPDDAVKWRAAAAEIAESTDPLFNNERKAFRKGFLLKQDGTFEYDDVLDVSSMYGPMMYAMHDFKLERIKQTEQLIERVLFNNSPSGGAPRYEHDGYFLNDSTKLGNPWFVTSLWIAQYYIRLNSPDKAQAIVDWTAAHALPSGVLSEQIDPTTGAQLSVAPLVWSHAELINTLLDLRKTK